MRVDRSLLRMTAKECDAFLAAHKWARVATVAADGEPYVSPVGYVALDRRLYFYGTEDARRTRDVRAGSRIALCIDAGVEAGATYSDRKGVVVHGACRVIDERETELLDRVRPAYAQALFGDPAVDFRRRTHVWFEVDPYRRTSWDFSKIPQGADRFSTR